MNTGIKPQIETALRAFSGSDLRAAASSLLNSLGYQSEKTLDLDNTPDAFLGEFDKRDRKFRKAKALFERWKSVEFLFQITDDEVRNADEQGTLFDSGYDHGNYQSYLFFALDLKKNHYTRTQLADITREINLLFDMPTMLLIRHNGALTFSIIDRRLHKKDQSRDVLEKVKLIKDIRYEDPHRAHIEILHDLALPTLMAKHECRDFKQLHEAWRTTLDTNELNKKFYRELADWYFWALDHVEYPSDVDKDTATRNATNVIRLLTRLIFCWFLKEKGLIPADLFSERKLAGVLNSLNDDDSSFYQAILQNLFFGTLNQRMNTGGLENRRFANDGPFLERKDEYGVKNLYRYQELFAIAEDEAVKLFSDIPFLNGGLFDCLDKEDDSGKVLYVDGFTRNSSKQPKVPNFLFFSNYRTLDLSDAYGDKKRKKEKVRGLINLLDSYKFTVTENTPIEEEIALDPELLGKVFENLLASYNPETGTTARKQTGSFYTPREIVNYMVDESLIAYLESQLKAKVPKLAEMKELQSLIREVFAYTEKSHPFDEGEVEALIDAIDNCKILDPACGSGAFPMGILHKLVFILGKLDPSNDRWKEKQIAKAEQIPDVSAREIAVGAIEKDFETNDLDYGRKLYLIENCIYGVDIQPIAIQISKLRFFISLICDQRTNNNKAQNCGVRPLPNLETKFVAANTLISLDRGQGQLLLTDPRLPKLESELAAVRHRHFAVQRRRNKLALQKRDAELREEIASVLAGGGMSGKASHRLAAWDPYDQNTSAPFFDAEWMYGITEGFHIVIGNPPYFNLKTVDKTFVKWLKKNYEVIHTGYNDIVYYFIYWSLLALSADGICTLITSNYYLGNEYAQKLRLAIAAHVSKVLNFKDHRVFSEASVHTCISFLHAGTPDDLVCFFNSKSDCYGSETTLENGMACVYVPRDDLQNTWLIADAEAKLLIQKLHSGSVLLGDIAEIEKGSTSGRNAVFSLSKLTALQLNIEQELLRRNVKNSDIDLYVVRNRDRCLIYVDNSTDIEAYPYALDYLKSRKQELSARNEVKKGLYSWYRFERPRRRLVFDATEKIVVPYRAPSNRFAYDNDQCFNDGGDIRAIVVTDNAFACKYVLALLNSSLLDWFYGFIGKPKGDAREYFNKPLSLIPIRRASRPEQKAICDLVDVILARKKNDTNADITDFAKEIDAKVYSLYDLKPQEIAIVEGQSR